MALHCDIVYCTALLYIIMPYLYCPVVNCNAYNTYVLLCIWLYCSLPHGYVLHYSVIVCSFFSLFCEFSRTKEKNEGQSVQSRWIVEILLGLHSRLIAGILASLQSNWKTDFFKESALGRFFHRVAMSVFLCICPFSCNFFEASHWPSGHMIRSWPLIGRPPPAPPK